MAKGKIINERLKQLVLLEYATNKNKSDVARTFNLPESTVRKIISKNPEQLQVCEQKAKDELLNEAIEWKQDFLKRAEDSISRAIDLSKQRIELALVSHEKFDERIDKIIELLMDKEANYRDVVDTVKALSSVMNIPLKDLSTYIGTLYDKRALANGDPTVRGEVKGEVKTSHEETYNIIQTIIQDESAANAITENFRSRIGTSPNSR